jgi:hypothetical protein
MPSGMIAPKTTTIPPSTRPKPVRTSSGTGALSRSPLGAGHVQPDDQLEDHGRDEGDRVDGHGQGPVAVVAEQPHRERHERDQSEEEQVAPEDHVVDAGDDAEDAVVGEPQLAEDQELRA